VTRDQVREIAAIKMADLTPTTSTARCADRRHRPLDGHRGRRLAYAAPTRDLTPVATTDRWGGRARPDRQEERHGKARQAVPRGRQARRSRRIYPPLEGVELVKDTTAVGFDAVDRGHLRLGVDPRHADQMVRGTVVLPHGNGKVVRVAVFAQGEKAQEALRAGADEVGWRRPGQEDRGGWLEFDVAIATPDSMGMVGSSARSSAVAA
jgi:hypothetical protein